MVALREIERRIEDIWNQRITWKEKDLACRVKQKLVGLGS